MDVIQYSIKLDEWEHETLAMEYEKHLRSSGVKVWRDTSFYLGLNEWVEATYKTKIQLTRHYAELLFETKEDLMWFRLRH